MNPRPTLLLCALALPGCGGGPEPDATTSASSGGLTGTTGSSSSTDAGAMTDAPTGGATTSEMSTGTGTSGPGLSTSSSSSGGDPSTGPVASTGTGTSGTTGEPAGPAPDWALRDVNPGSATHDQLVSPSSHAGKVSGWYFAHAT